ncbi:MAG TPA: Ldh family oxidoreductase [Nitrososphaerales archaeon]|nr:Ldh family oxidoreductase [Nitrososphaerales archaeon]
MSFISAPDLREFTKVVFIKAGVKAAHAETVAHHLVQANLRGVDSHGVARIPYYLSGIRLREVNVDPKIRTITDSKATALVDGDFALGQVAGKYATELATRKASEFGVGVVGVKRTSHVGMLAYYGMMIAERRMVGQVFTDSPPFMAAAGGKKPVLGTNPVCITFPYDGAGPVVLDMATSESAAFKIMSAASRGESIPEGWALDRNGNPTTSPKEALEGALLPFGGYKGYGLAVAVELFSSVLLGAEWSTRVKMAYYTEGGLYVQAVDVSHFRPYEEYLRDMKEVVKGIKTSGKGKARDEVYLPGEKEAITAAERSAHGIPIDAGLKKELAKVSEELGVPLPLKNPV